MRLNELSKPVDSKTLNENLAKRFGQSIDTSKFSLEQLQDAQNKLRTKLFNVEANESFSDVHTDGYQKNKMFLDVITTAIAEREQIQEEPTDITAIKEGAEEEATLVMAAKDMVDRITGWMEDTAEMQTESMLELGDKIRDEMGSEQSETFIGTVKPALETLFTTLEGTRDALTSGVAILTGEGDGAETMGDEAPAEEEPAMEPTVDQEAGAEGEVPAEGEDEFAAADAAAGGEAEAGREQRESIEKSRKLGLLLAGSKKKA